MTAGTLTQAASSQTQLQLCDCVGREGQRNRKVITNCLRPTNNFAFELDFAFELRVNILVVSLEKE